MANNLRLMSPMRTKKSCRSHDVNDGFSGFCDGQVRLNTVILTLSMCILLHVLMTSKETQQLKTDARFEFDLVSLFIINCSSLCTEA